MVSAHTECNLLFSLFCQLLFVGACHIHSVKCILNTTFTGECKKKNCYAINLFMQLLCNQNTRSHEKFSKFYWWILFTQSIYQILNLIYPTLKRYIKNILSFLNSSYPLPEFGSSPSVKYFAECHAKTVSHVETIKIELVNLEKLCLLFSALNNQITFDWL
jgi:hypothetical protein